MKTAGYDNIEVARNLLEIIDWCLECEQIERRNNDSKNDIFNFSYNNAWNEYKKSDACKEIEQLIKNSGRKPRKKTKRTRKNCSKSTTYKKVSKNT